MPKILHKGGSTILLSCFTEGRGVRLCSRYLNINLHTPIWSLSTNLFMLVDELSENLGRQPRHLGGGSHLRVTDQATTYGVSQRCYSLIHVLRDLGLRLYILGLDGPGAWRHSHRRHRERERERERER